MERHNSAGGVAGDLASPVAYVGDSEAHSRACIVDALLEQGFVCRDFTRASDLLDAFGIKAPQLIVLDLSQRDFDGIEALRSLKANRFAGGIIPITELDGGEGLAQIARGSGLKMLPPVPKPLRARNLEVSLGHLDPPPMGPELVIDIDEAIRNQWITLWYQPKVDLQSLSVCGAEALVRILHPDLGLIPPSRFLPGSSDPKMRLLSHFVVKRALHDWMMFVECRRPLEIAINVPTAVLVEAQFIRFFRNHLPIHPRFSGIIVEVDEAEAPGCADSVARLAAQLGELKIRISINDLTCCSPFVADTERFPFSEIKVGKQFVSGCAADHLKRALCQTIVEITRRFGALSVAVGVETSDDLAAVQELGFDVAQGFFFGRPMPPEELALLIAMRRGSIRGLQARSAST
jgi:EAL domain-containing protein (putative c-di-GMP-specific phosphodiesterase class I)